MEAFAHTAVCLKDPSNRCVHHASRGDFDCVGLLSVVLLSYGSAQELKCSVSALAV